MLSLALGKSSLHSRLTGRSLLWLACLLVISGGLSLTVLLASLVHDSERNQLRERFSQIATERLSRIQERFGDQLKELDALQRFFLNSQTVSRDEFQGFVEPLLDDTLAYSWVPWVVRSERPVFEEEARADGLRRFRFHDLDKDGTAQASPERDHYLPVFYSVSGLAGRLPLGLDLSSQPERAALLDKARAGRQAVASDALTLIGVPGADARGILMAVPVFNPAATEGHALRGFVLGVISLRREMEQGIPDEVLGSLAMRLIDITEEDDPQALYLSKAEDDDSGLLITRSFAFADRTYRLELRPSGGFAMANRSSAWHLVIATGGLITLLMAAYLMLLISQRQRALRLVAERTRELRERELDLKLSEERWAFALDSAGHGVWDWEIASDTVYYSRAWKGMLGYDVDEVPDEPELCLRLQHPDDAPAVDAALQRHLRGEAPIYQSEHRMQRKGGAWVWVLDRGKVVEWNPDGSPLRMIGTQTDISASKAAELQLALAHGQLRGVLDAATQVSIIATDLDGFVLQFNVGAERMLGYSAAEMVGKRPRMLHLEAEIQARCEALSKRLSRPIRDFHHYVVEVTAGDCYDEHEWTYVRKDGGHLTGNLILTGVRDQHDQLVGYLGVAIDVTDRKRVQEALEDRDRLLQKLSARVPGAIYQYQLYPDGRHRFPYVSAGVSDILEVEPEQVSGDASQAFTRLHPEDLERIYASILHSAAVMQTWREDFRVLLPRQGLRWLRGESEPERMADGSVLWHGYISDVTGHKLVEQELRALSITDALTGVFNRRHFQERLDAEIARALRSEGPFSLVMLDIDHFKLVNDQHGHEAGDRVLKQLCQRIGQRLRRIDVLCRLGGEEFIVLCPETNLEQARSLAEALLQGMRRDEVAGVGHVTASFGCACWRDGETADALLRRVDTAAYSAKQGGRDQVCCAE
ncbi:diguanylate cyclase [Pseudomonas solani]|uniref:sensor domain-containing diguanylate cyclase n=1 Tax=Pseudomonas solani TaxID=2731552 RepID=UPI0035BE30A4